MQDRNLPPHLPDLPDLLDADLLRAALPARVGAGPVALEVVWSVDSTNSELWRRPPPDGCAVLLAECQTGGRGRLGRPWISPLSAQVCLSLRYRSGGGLARLDGLSLVAGLAVAEALHGLGFTQAGLKWPNDVVAGGAKLAGLLVECRGERAGPVHVVVGVGINVCLPQAAAAAIDQPWTDLARLSSQDRPPSRNTVAVAVLGRLLEVLDQFGIEGLAPFLSRYAARDTLVGRQVRLTAGRQVIEGRALGLADDGGLRVDTGLGVQVFHAGEVSVRTR